MENPLFFALGKVWANLLHYTGFAILFFIGGGFGDALLAASSSDCSGVFAGSTRISIIVPRQSRRSENRHPARVARRFCRGRCTHGEATLQKSLRSANVRFHNVLVRLVDRNGAHGRHTPAPRRGCLRVRVRTVAQFHLQLVALSSCRRCAAHARVIWCPVTGHRQRARLVTKSPDLLGFQHWRRTPAIRNSSCGSARNAIIYPALRRLCYHRLMRARLGSLRSRSRWRSVCAERRSRSTETTEHFKGCRGRGS